jgi:hypothetical protein
MAYVYFHKSDGRFQFASETRRDCPWNDEYEVPDASADQIYSLEGGAPVLVGVIDTSGGDPKPAWALAELRADRDRRLAETDWWVLPDRTPTEAQLAYRQALRDITNTYTSIEDVVWPQKVD